MQSIRLPSWGLTAVLALLLFHFGDCGSVVVERGPRQGNECSPIANNQPLNPGGNPQCPHAKIPFPAENDYKAWSNPANAANTNAGDAADVSLGGKDPFSTWLQLTDFGLTDADLTPIPGSTIDGMEVVIDQQGDSASRFAVALIVPQNGGRAVTQFFGSYPTLDAQGCLPRCNLTIRNPALPFVSQPASGSLWPFVSPSTGDIRTINLKDANFGIAILARGSNQLMVFRITVRIFITTPTTAGAPGATTAPGGTATQTTSTAGGGGGGGVPLFAIVGAAVGAAVLIAAIILIVILVKRHRASKSLNSTFAEPLYPDHDHSMEMDSGQTSALLGKNFLL